MSPVTGLESRGMSDQETSVRERGGVFHRAKLKYIDMVNEDLTYPELTKTLINCSNTAPGHDSIYYIMLQKLCDKDLRKLLVLYNRVWREGGMPTAWKLSLLAPIAKQQEDREKVSNYRPIQMLPVIAKVMDKMVAKRFSYLMEAEGIADPRQAGCRRKRSVTDNLVGLENLIQENISRGREVLTFFFDIEKAYDTVSRKKLLKTLEDLGVEGNLYRYAVDFLTNRQFKVKIGEDTSSVAEQEEGVPQGLSFSVQLFKVAMDCVRDFIGECESFLYVDDIAIAFVLNGKFVKPYQKRRIQNCLDNLVRWSENFGLKLSHKKSKMVKFSRRPRSTKLLLPVFKIGEHPIEQITEAKFLGVILDETLSFRKQIDDTVKKTTKDLGIIRYLGSNRVGVCRDQLLMILNSKVRSKLEYGSIIMDKVANGHWKKLEVVYNKGLRICLGAFRTTPVKSLYGEAGVPYLRERRSEMAKRFVIKVLGQQEHFLLQMLAHQPKPWNAAQAKRKNNRESVLRETYRELEVEHLNNIANTQAFTIIPTWLESTVKVDMLLHSVSKASQCPSVWQKEALEKINEYNGYTIRYTDGSKLDERTGFGVASKDRTVCFDRLSDGTSVYTAENAAIYSGASTDLEEDERVALFSDSLAALEALAARDDNNPSTLLFLNQLEELKREIVLVWIPSHMGIKGNEDADTAAKRGRDIDSEPEKLYSVQDALEILRKKSLKEREENWKKTENNFLRTIKNEFRRLKLPLSLSRKEERIITRLRLGHTRFTNQHVFHKLEAIPCVFCIDHNENENDVRVTVSHILKSCKMPEVVESRQKYNVNFDSLSNPDQYENVFDFLRELSLFDEM